MLFHCSRDFLVPSTNSCCFLVSLVSSVTLTKLSLNQIKNGYLLSGIFKVTCFIILLFCFQCLTCCSKSICLRRLYKNMRNKLHKKVRCRKRAGDGSSLTALIRLLKEFNKIALNSLILRLNKLPKRVISFTSE